MDTAIEVTDEKMMYADAQDPNVQLENLHTEIDRLHGELAQMQSENIMLKDTIVIMSMKMVGVVN